MELESAKQAKEHLLSQNITIKPGYPYNIYKCGCVYRQDKDPINYAHIDNSRNRCCPEHQQRLLTRFKQCNCGREYIAYNLNISVGCKQCKVNLKKKRANGLTVTNVFNCKYFHTLCGSCIKPISECEKYSKIKEK